MGIQDNALPRLNVAIGNLNLAKEASSITPVKAAFGSAAVLIVMIRDSVANEPDYVALGLSYADTCRALERGTNEKKLGDLSRSVCEAMEVLTTTVAEIQTKVIKQSKRNAVSRFLRARNDKEKIAAWKSDLDKILLVFNTELELAPNTRTIVSDIHQNLSRVRLDTDGQDRATQNSMLGESPPPAPRDFFGRGELIEKIVGLAENLTPITLIGTGGIGKTSIALTVLHDNRIKQRFGDNRRFIRCDQFPVSRVHFLRRLSEVTGAGIEDPKDLNHLRVFLSSKEMIIVLDNAESILDPQGMSAQEIYATVEELGRFGNICLCITSRISTVPPDCKILNIPTLSTEAARDAFYRVYEHEQSNPVNKILEQLDFHPLSITLLATVAQHNKWDASRLAREWEEGRTGALHTQHSESLGKTIELSLVSPTFRELGPDARWLLGVVAFFPQGINESNLEWFFPTTSNRTTIFNKLCVLSLTYRSDGFIMMLAPLRDYFCPKDPKSSQLLCAIKECYFTRLSVDLYPGRPGFEEARWITSEDVNVEHLFDVFTTVDANPGDIFTTIDANSGDVWDACAKFMRHLYWHKRRPITLGPKINRLPDGHCSKPECLLELSQLFGSIGNYAESKRLLSHALRLQRKRGDDCKVARTLSYLADTHRRLGLDEEGMQLAEEALEIYKRLSDTSGHVQCLYYLAWLLYDSEQLDDAEETASHAINLLPEKGDQFLACKCHRVLGNIYRSRGDREKAINHYETALGIASSFNWHDQLFWGHYSLARLFADEGRSDDALAHTEHAKSHAVNNPYLLGRAMKQQAWFWYALQRLEEARSEALRASDVFERVGATQDLEDCKELLREIGNE